MVTTALTFLPSRTPGSTFEVCGGIAASTGETGPCLRANSAMPGLLTVAFSGTVSAPTPGLRPGFQRRSGCADRCVRRSALVGSARRMARYEEPHEHLPHSG